MSLRDKFNTAELQVLPPPGYTTEADKLAEDVAAVAAMMPPHPRPSADVKARLAATDADELANEAIGLEQAR